MSLLEFEVIEILAEVRAPLYELYGMTKKEAEEAPDNPGKYLYFLDGVKQALRISASGRESVRTKVFCLSRGERPYEVGYRGLI